MLSRPLLCGCGEKCTKCGYAARRCDRSNCVAQGVDRLAEPSRWLWQPEHLPPRRARSRLGQDSRDPVGGVGQRFSHSLGPGGESAELIGLEQVRTRRPGARGRGPEPVLEARS